MTRLAVKDDLLDAQALRAAGVAAYGGADVGECIATVRRVNGTDLGSWYRQWTATAAQAEQLADRAAAAGAVETARLAYFRASTYYRTAGCMLLAPAAGGRLDDRLLTSNAAQTRTFRAGAHLLGSPPSAVAIPYEGTTLPGYFFTVDASGRPRPTVVLLGGYDGTAEELYFLNGAAALARGYNVLAFDGPGQGSALIQQGLVLRPDWDQVIGPVLDYLIARSDVEPARVALIGLSLGAHLAARAAATEHRFAAVICDCGSYDMFEAAIGRMPAPLAGGFRDRRPTATKIVTRILGTLESKPTAGWALRRGQLVHGVDSPTAYLDALRDYTLVGRVQKITCPTLVCSAENDEISASAPELAAALTCEHDHFQFTTAQGADDHCEAGARVLYHARTFDWLDQHLHSAGIDPGAGITTATLEGKSR